MQLPVLGARQSRRISLIVTAMTMMAGEGGARPRIYQLMVRHFGNTNETRKPHGTLAENGCGKFADIDATALESLKSMGFTHLWLTGVLEQASGTDYPGRPADDRNVLKGEAGSPYAIKDYFDVCPDYAVESEQRLVEFRALLGRCEAAGMRTLIDFVPNHVARTYESDVMPALSFGNEDDRSVFFDRDNNFYYLGSIHRGGGPPLKMPTGGLPGCDGLFAPETEFGRVTGNNVVNWEPSIHDWYETVKLNYGHDFTTGRDTTHLPGPDAHLDSVPDTWRKMDAVLAFWQEMGVGGFRVDMAHMVPMEFWRWVVKRTRTRDTTVFFMAEAYDNDPAKLTDGNVLDALLKAGFDAVYDDPTYDLIHHIYEGPKWANDIDELTWIGDRHNASLRYAENHDEIRLANPHRWAGIGMPVGRPVAAILFGIGGGPVMIYNGQEVGEPALGAEGFSGDDARTSLFDYWSLPELTKWVNGHAYDGGGLSSAQKELRAWYGKLLHLLDEPALRHGWLYGLNHANGSNPDFGRIGDETVSGHWMYAFLRSERRSGGQSFLVVVNLHGGETMRSPRIEIPKHALQWLAMAHPVVSFADRLATDWGSEVDRRDLPEKGLVLPDLPPCSALYLEIQ